LNGPHRGECGRARQPGNGGHEAAGWTARPSDRRTRDGLRL